MTLSGIAPKFADMHVNKEYRFSLGIEERTGEYYLSIPVTNSRIDYEEYFKISKNEFDSFIAKSVLATDFARQCCGREHDD